MHFVAFDGRSPLSYKQQCIEASRWTGNCPVSNSQTVADRMCVFLYGCMGVFVWVYGCLYGCMCSHIWVYVCVLYVFIRVCVFMGVHMGVWVFICVYGVFVWV